MRSKKNASMKPYTHSEQQEVAPYQHEDRMRDNMFGSMGMPSFSSQSNLLISSTCR